MTASVACLMLGNWATATCEGITGAKRMVTLHTLQFYPRENNKEIDELTLRDNTKRAFRTDEQFCDIKAS